MDTTIIETTIPAYVKVACIVSPLYGICIFIICKYVNKHFELLEKRINKIEENITLD